MMCISRTALAVAFSLSVIPAVALTAPAADAATTIKISKVTYDPTGDDLPVSNTKLNREWVQIKNTTKTARQLKGWTVRDKQNHVYKLPATLLGAGKTITVRTGKGTNNPSNRYWGQSNYVWNNTGDQATLRSAGGTVMYRCSWGNESGVKSC